MRHRDAERRVGFGFVACLYLQHYEDCRDKEDHDKEDEKVQDLKLMNQHLCVPGIRERKLPEHALCLAKVCRHYKCDCADEPQGSKFPEKLFNNLMD